VGKMFARNSVREMPGSGFYGEFSGGFLRKGLFERNCPGGSLHVHAGLQVSICVVVVIWVTLVNTQTHLHTHIHQTSFDR